RDVAWLVVSSVGLIGQHRALQSGAATRWPKGNYKALLRCGQFNAFVTSERLNSSCVTCNLRCISLTFNEKITVTLKGAPVAQLQKKLAIFRVFPQTYTHDDQGTFRLHG